MAATCLIHYSEVHIAQLEDLFTERYQIIYTRMFRFSQKKISNYFTQLLFKGTLLQQLNFSCA